MSDDKKDHDQDSDGDRRPGEPGDEDGGGGDDGQSTPPELDWTGDGLLDEQPKPVAPTGGARRRAGGGLALLLGVFGVLLALVLGFNSLRLLFGATSRVDDAIDPVETAFDRLEDRIDQADDLIDRRGIDADVVGELQARVDGLVDVTTAAERSFETIDGHPVYGLLPADLSGLGQNLDRFAASAAVIEESLGSANAVRPATAATMADEIDGMQGRVTGARGTIDDATSSLRSWLRIGGLLGLVIAVWLLWSQVVFVRRGWRGFRDRDL